MRMAATSTGILIFFCTLSETALNLVLAIQTLQASSLAILDLKIPIVAAGSIYWQSGLAINTNMRYQFLSHELQCYTRISGLENSCYNTREKYNIFSCVDIANQLLTGHSPLAPLGQVDKWMNLNKSCLSKLSRIMAAKTLKNLYRWQAMRFKLS